MKQLVVLALLLSGPTWGLLTRVHDRNVAVAVGAAAYARGDAPRAANAFAAALEANAQRVADPRLLLNLAHAHLRAGQLAPARVAYGRLLAGSPAPFSSVARQQLAVLTAQQGEIAQALSLLKQALVLDPTNAAARFDFEVLSDFIAKRQGPRIPSPPPAQAPKPSPDKNGGEKNSPAEQAGNQRQGQINAPEQAQNPPNSPPERRPDAKGQADNRGGRTPGAGTSQPLATGTNPGSQQGLDRGNESGTGPNGTSYRAGAEAAAGDLRLQTQRERLEAMNLSPAQARQILETLRAQEQQYLQQLTRPAQQKADPSKPTW
ncbi:MAG TPA: hypothetical protein VF629_12800 [Hymenobacter sp.]|jgi:tetratricopeptide (TPR) repeat protein|uniref:hypothetical protein n=1 Tax=Hymenobacter sp. TaxID=1898978 RepID=UPI002ED7A3A0